MKSKCKHYDFELAQAAGISIDRFPETKEEAQAATDLLVQSLQRMSMEEHETILWDIHGLDEVIHEEETIPFVNEKLAELQLRLDEITVKDAYNLALQLNSSYVCSLSFRLMFLRCERFNVQAAAELMVLHFEEKQRLFGNGEILARDILQSDLRPNVRKVLESGVLQVMKKQDSAGRLIIVVLISKMNEVMNNNFSNIDDSYRVLWYISMASARDKESQKKGFVWLVMNLCEFKTPMEMYRGVGALHSAIPHRIAAGHFCYDDPTLHPYAAGYHLFVGEEYRVRIRTHFGMRDEIDLALQTFGIPTDVIPLHKNGTCILKDHLEWLDVTQKQEVNNRTSTIRYAIKESTTLPHRFDVLFGKSNMAREHPGTLRAWHLVQMHFAAYEKLSKYQKTDVADNIVSAIHESGGRFRKQNVQGYWIEVSDVEARKKVAHWFRQLRSKNGQCQLQDAVHRYSQVTPELVKPNNHSGSIETTSHDNATTTTNPS